MPDSPGLLGFAQLERYRCSRYFRLSAAGCFSGYRRVSFLPGKSTPKRRLVSEDVSGGFSHSLPLLAQRSRLGARRPYEEGRWRWKDENGFDPGAKFRLIFSDFGHTGSAEVQIPLPPLLCIASIVVCPRNQGGFCTGGAGTDWINAPRNRILSCAYSSSISRR